LRPEDAEKKHREWLDTEVRRQHEERFARLMAVPD
jgi:hypothetical protein